MTSLTVPKWLPPTVSASVYTVWLYSDFYTHEVISKMCRLSGNRWRFGVGRDLFPADQWLLLCLFVCLFVCLQGLGISKFILLWQFAYALVELSIIRVGVFFLWEWLQWWVSSGRRQLCYPHPFMKPHPSGSSNVWRGAARDILVVALAGHNSDCYSQMFGLRSWHFQVTRNLRKSSLTSIYFCQFIDTTHNMWNALNNSCINYIHKTN